MVCQQYDKSGYIYDQSTYQIWRAPFVMK